MCGRSTPAGVLERPEDACITMLIWLCALRASILTTTYRIVSAELSTDEWLKMNILNGCRSATHVTIHSVLSSSFIHGKLIIKEKKNIELSNGNKLWHSAFLLSAYYSQIHFGLRLIYGSMVLFPPCLPEQLQWRDEKWNGALRSHRWTSMCTGPYAGLYP